MQLEAKPECESAEETKEDRGASESLQDDSIINILHNKHYKKNGLD